MGKAIRRQDGTREAVAMELRNENKLTYTELEQVTGGDKDLSNDYKRRTNERSGYDEAQR